jgi:hypothetical protein
VDPGSDQYVGGMAVVETVTHVQVGSGACVEQLVCHPRLPLVAGLDSERPAVHVWDCGAGELHELGTAGTDSAVYGDADGWERMKRTPTAAWHPDQPLLLVASEGAVVRWTPAGVWRSARTVRCCGHRHRPALRMTHGSTLTFSISLREPSVPARVGTLGLRRIQVAGWWPRCAVTKTRRSDSSRGWIKRARLLQCACFAGR